MSPRYAKDQKKHIGKWTDKPITLECWACGEEWIYRSEEGCTVQEFICNVPCPNTECDSTIHLFVRLGGIRKSLDTFFG